MTIYSSDKAVPYVYICTHKDTNQFYIGYREKNVKLNRPSHLDLPEYKTSSTKVRPDWENYTWTIIAEFFDPSHAYMFEQQLICDNWKNPLLLNGQYRLGKIKQFRNSGPSPLKGKPSGRKGIPSPKKGIPTGPQSAEHIKKCTDAKKGKKRGPHSNKTKKKMHDARIGKPSPKKGKPGKPCSAETKQKMHEIMTGRPSPLKGRPSGRKGIPTGLQRNPTPEVECPHCGLVGRGGNMKRYHFDNCKKKPI